MNRRPSVADMLGIEHSIIQAPMVGGVTTPELVAAVSNAGALGSIGAGYLEPDALRDVIRATCALTNRPFAVNLFVPQPFEVSEAAVARSNRLMQPFREALEIAPPAAIAGYARSFEDQLAVVLEEGISLFSFTFGIPEAASLKALRDANVTTIGTATTVAEAVALESVGIDIVVAQGAEAGGHRGTFLHPPEQAMVGTMALVPQVVDAVSIPVIASGGIMDRRGVQAAYALGADAAQMGSAFLACSESGAHAPHKAALAAADDRDTAVTRAFSGKPARGIMNRFMRDLANDQPQLPDYPVQNAWTKDIRAAAASQGNPDFMSLWAGQAAGMARSTSAAALIESICCEDASG